MLSLKWLLLYLHTLGALVLRADVNIWQLSHKSFIEDESLGFEKKYRKNQFGPVLLMIQIVIKTKQLRYDFLALVCFFFGKQLIFLKIKRALRILESETQICAIEEDIFIKI